jgi:hypothetical protein
VLVALAVVVLALEAAVPAQTAAALLSAVQRFN